MTLKAEPTKPKQKAKPLPKAPTPKRKFGKPRDMHADAPGRYVTKGREAGPGDDEGDDDEQERRA